MSGETGSSLWGQNKPRVREQEGAGRSWEGGSKTQSCNQPCLLRPSPQAHCCLGGHESPAVTPSWRSAVESEPWPGREPVGPAGAGSSSISANTRKTDKPTPVAALGEGTQGMAGGEQDS